MNSLVPPPQVGQRDGNWMWNGQNWVCDPDCGDGFPQFRPPPPWFPPPATSPPWYPGGNAGVSFSPPGSPPPNPIRGNFWWDGYALWMFDGAAWVSVGGAAAGGGGVVTPPGSTFPTNPVPGQQFFDGKTLWIWDGNAWIPTTSTKTYIQATAPPAPNPGDTWWNGTQFFVWSGTAWDAVGPGATVGPVPTTTQVFSLLLTPPGSTFNCGTGSISVCSFGSVLPIIDPQGMWDPVTHKIMPKVAGNYQFFTGHQMEPGTLTYGTHFLLKNDSGTWTGADIVVTAAGVSSAGTSINDYKTGANIVHMNGNTDFVRLFGLSNNGTLASMPNFPVISAWLLP